MRGDSGEDERKPGRGEESLDPVAKAKLSSRWRTRAVCLYSTKRQGKVKTLRVIAITYSVISHQYKEIKKIDSVGLVYDQFAT